MVATDFGKRHRDGGDDSDDDRDGLLIHLRPRGASVHNDAAVGEIKFENCYFGSYGVNFKRNLVMSRNFGRIFRFGGGELGFHDRF